MPVQSTANILILIRLSIKKIKRTMPTEKEAIAEAQKALKAWETAYIENTTYKEGIQLIPVETELVHKSRIFLEGNINSENCNEIIKQIMFLSEQDDNNEIELFIDSFGGEVQAGLALYDVMRMIDKPIRTIILGKAASNRLLVIKR